VDDWKRVTFSDESMIFQLPPMQRYVRRPPGANALDPRYTCKTVKHPPGLMIWGTCSWRGPGALTFLERGTMMNADKYIEVLSEKLVDTMNNSGSTVFQQDNAPCHKARKVMTWFLNNGIEVMDWPPNSPDLNPIENLWRSLKMKLKTDNTKNTQQLQQAISAIWMNDILRLECEKLVESLPRRIAAVLRNRGYPTKY
jgi:hypothetical protein